MSGFHCTFNWISLLLFLTKSPLTWYPPSSAVSSSLWESNPGTVKVLHLLLMVRWVEDFPRGEIDLSLGGKISLWLARKRTTSRFSFFIGTMSRRQVKGAPAGSENKKCFRFDLTFHISTIKFTNGLQIIVFLIALDC